MFPASVRMRNISKCHVPIRLADNSTRQAIATGTVALPKGSPVVPILDVTGLRCSISRQLPRYYHDTCEKWSFVALLDMDGVSHFYVLEWSTCLSDPAKSLVVEPDRNFSKILVFRRVFGAVFSSIIA
jgi:hypothetical protein